LVAPRLRTVGKSQVKIARSQIDALTALDRTASTWAATRRAREWIRINARSTNRIGPGPLSKVVPLDPWGHPYVYAGPGTHNNDIA
jgi:general secretion pathway protein G